MNNSFYDNDDLNQFLQQETDKHKLFPSDKIWRNIHQELHGKKSWPALTVIAFMIIVALTISTIIYDHPVNTSFKTVPITSLSSSTNTITAGKKISKRIRNKAAENNYKQAELSEMLPSINVLTDDNNFIEEKSLLVNSNTTFPSEINNIPVKVVNEQVNTVGQFAQQTVNSNKSEETNIRTNQLAQGLNKPFEKGSIAVLDYAPTTKLANDKSNFAFNAPNIKALKSKADDEFKADEFVQDLGYEKALVFKPKPKASRFELLFYATPSISYRKLVDDKTRNYYEPVTAPNGPISPIYSVNINDVVRHKPAMGTEIGFGFLYKINSRLKFKTGLQFNVRKYFIDSYKSGLNVASIAIIRNNRLDTISQLTSISANSGYAETELNSKLYQVSVPLGIQWQVIQLKRFGISLAGSVQPTLTLNKNVYLLSTDYKYYTDGTPFFRKWNVNTSAEINLTYKVGNYNWYLGPQLRYQHLPTYTEKYPIKEHRLDYGLRIGFTKQLFK